MANPILKFEDGQSHTILFPNPNGEEVDGKWGKQYRYDVECQGEMYTLFATGGLQKELRGLHLRRDAVVRVQRLGSGTDTRWDVSLTSAGEGPAAPVTRVQKATPDERVASYKECLKMAMRVWHDQEIRAGLQVLNLDAASPDARFMALKDVATHLSMGMGREWAFAVPEPPKPEPTPEPPPSGGVPREDLDDLPFAPSYI